MAQENLLRAAHDIIGESITDRLPGPHDDAGAEVAEERLIIRAREFVSATSRREVIGG